MDTWVLFFLAISLVLSLKLLLPKLNPSSHNKPTLPPGPPAIPFVVKTTLQRKSLFELESVVRQLHSKYGPIVALRIPFRPTTVFITDRSLAHEALVHVGAALADRPSIVRGPRVIVSSHADITSSSYGPLWRSLRRNLTAEMLHPSRVKLFSHGREWALRILLNKFRLQAEIGDRVVRVMEGFQFAMFSLLVLMCFGEKIDEKAIEEVQSLQYYFLRLFIEFNPFAVLPGITKHVFRRRWNEIVAALRRQEEIFVPLIRLRQQQKLGRREGEFAYSYVDSLLEVELEGGRRLREDEIASLCHEFMSAGTDTTSTALQWIMAQLVKHQEIQGKLFEEIEEVVAAGGEDEIKEEELQRMPYLKAVVMEGLRRHPPGHFVLPHKAAKDVVLNDGQYLIPKGAEVHINVAELGWDGNVWKEPMAFKPERFLEGGDGSGVDITGSREIKMMPFGAGRRVCPGSGLALLHLEYFVANLVREFEWKAVEGEEVDLSERLEFTTVMKYPLRARICARKDS